MPAEVQEQHGNGDRTDDPAGADGLRDAGGLRVLALVFSKRGGAREVTSENHVVNEGQRRRVGP